jgi:hypothetical protein
MGQLIADVRTFLQLGADRTWQDIAALSLGRLQ